MQSAAWKCCRGRWRGRVVWQISKGSGSEVRCFRDSFELPSQR